MFLTTKRQFADMLEIAKNHFYPFFLQNMYDTNEVNKHNSYPHFIERRFGILS